jgi:hypothetical protein
MERGRTPITLIVTDATGLKINESPISHRGVRSAKSMVLEISSDHKHVLIHARLRRGNEAFARKGAIFWMVRPEVSAESVSGLTTIFSGPYIEAKPGTGEVTKEFVIRSSRPLALGEGVQFVLRAPRRQSLTPGSPLYYHGIQVGMIEDVRLSNDGEREIPIPSTSDCRSCGRIRSSGRRAPTSRVDCHRAACGRVAARSRRRSATPTSVGAPAIGERSSRSATSNKRNGLHGRPSSALADLD